MISRLFGMNSQTMLYVGITSFGNQSFSAAGPRVWNSLPLHLQQDVNLVHF